MEKQPDIRELAARLKTLGVIMKISREMSDAADFTSAAAIAANSPEVLLHFCSAALVEYADGKAQIVGQYGLFEPNPHSDHAVNLTRLGRELSFIESGKSKVFKTTEDNEELSDGAKDALAALLGGDHEMVVLHLAHPGYVENPEFELFWLIEFSR